MSRCSARFFPRGCPGWRLRTARTAPRLRTPSTPRSLGPFEKLARHEAIPPRARAPRVPRGVDEDGLIGPAIQDAEHALPRRVRLVGDYAELLADERVQQRRLADVRSADDRHEPAAAFVCFIAAHRSTHRASLQRLPA